MKRLTLLRHAKSSWQDESLADHARPLNTRGQRDAPVMAERLGRRAPAPDYVLASSSRRTLMTARAVMQVLAVDESRLELRDALYLASPDTLRQEITRVPESTEHLLVIGHNPGLEMLAAALCDTAPARLPTAALVHLLIDGDNFDTRRWPIQLAFADWPKKAH